MCEYSSCVLLKIKTTFTIQIIIFFRNKAVSDGAISFYLDHIVRTRVSKFTYGSFIHVAYDPSNPDHQYRSHRVFISASGARRLLGSFSIILPKVSCFLPLLKKFEYVLLFVEYPSFGDKGIQTILLLGFRDCSWFTIC